MEKLSVCFIGVGSIAKRHIKNLYEICQGKSISLRIDAVRRNGAKPDEGIAGYIDNVYTDYSQFIMRYDIIFVTNPTEMHIETLKKYNDFSDVFFIEKPISGVGQIHEAEALDSGAGKLYYVACPLRYNSVIEYIKNNIDKDSVISVRSISSSYLPEWRVGVDYRDTYSAHKNLGGGVSIDLIHEWDYLFYLFGKPSNIAKFIGKKSKLEIDSDDYAIYIAEYDTMIAELHLDYFGRKAIRQIEIITDEDTIIGDIINGSLSFLKSGKEIHFIDNRDDFQKKELVHFLEIVEKRIPSDNNLNHAINILKLTQGEL